jgi:hypothetical protein
MANYNAVFPCGTQVKIAGRETLENFFRSWRYHNPLKQEQLELAGKNATVKEVGFYHGGDSLYVLNEVPGTWHEECLQSA